MRIPVILIMLLTFLLDAAVLSYSVTRREHNRTFVFSVLTAAATLYALGYLLAVISPNAQAAMTAIKVENAGIAYIGPFFLLFILVMCEYKFPLKRLILVAFLYCFAIFLVVLFNEQHYLYYTSIAHNVYSGISVATLGRGPLYVLHQAVSIGCTLVAYSVLVMRLSVWAAKIKRQMRLIFAGAAITLVANAANLLRIVPYGLDPTPVALMLALFCFSVGIYKYRLFDIIPIATEMAVDTMDDAMIVLDNECCYIFSNQSAHKLIPALEKTLVTQHIGDIQGWPLALKGCTKAGQIPFEIQSEGETHYYRARISMVGKDSAPMGWSIVVRDVTETTNLLMQMEMLATTDSLTGIYNRRYFIELVERELAIAERHTYVISMILFDLDHFKEVNDTHGHLAGDAVLQGVVEAVKFQLRPYDIFSRYGGEEFMLFSIGVELEGAISFARRLCAAVEAAQILYQGKRIPITASFGVTEMQPGDSIEDATDAADAAMYKAKQNGRNRVEAVRINRK